MSNGPGRQVKPGIYSRDGELIIDAHAVLEAHGVPATPENIRALERVAADKAAQAGATFEAIDTESPRHITCPYCHGDGARTDLNGARWRCHACGGGGRIIAPRAPP